MGSIRERVSTKGQKSFLACIAMLRNGTVYRESKTFERRPPAVRWMKDREAELRAPGAILDKNARNRKPTLGDALGTYLRDQYGRIGKTKRSTLMNVRRDVISEMECSEIRSVHLREFMDRRVAIGNSTATVGNYLAHLSSVFRIAHDAYDFPLDYNQIIAAQRVGRSLGKISSSSVRKRLPTLDELDRILTYLEEKETRGDTTYPIVRIILFALYSTRRSAEIMRIRWEDLERGDAKNPPRVLVRDMKNPGKTKGNDTYCILPPEAMRIVETMPQTAPEIFPYDGKTAGTYFQRAVAALGIEDLHFHDLRHAGVTRLAEMGRTDMEMRSVSGHRGAASLIRYSHYRATGDRFADWPWLERAVAKFERNNSISRSE